MAGKNRSASVGKKDAASETALRAKVEKAFAKYEQEERGTSLWRGYEDVPTVESKGAPKFQFFPNKRSGANALFVVIGAIGIYGFLLGYPEMTDHGREHVFTGTQRALKRKLHYIFGADREQVMDLVDEHNREYERRRSL